MSRDISEGRTHNLVASQGGSGTDEPGLVGEDDDLDAVAQVELGACWRVAAAAAPLAASAMSWMSGHAQVRRDDDSELSTFAASRQLSTYSR